ncbi:MAG: dihydroneopterin aldolase [Candidatus Margulisiibacteriota bacterium]|jgi:FolB domain-containing protein
MKKIKEFKFTVSQLKIKTIVGCNPNERKKKRIIYLDYSYVLKKNPVLINDNLENTINYHTLAKALKENLESKSFYLIETIAQKALEIILANHLVKKAKVTVIKSKPFAEVKAVVTELKGKN